MWIHPAAGRAETVSLAQLEERAVAHYPQIEAAEAGVAKLQARLTEIRWKPFSEVRVEALVAPTPERRGDSLHSAQRDISISFSSDWGVLLRASLDGSFPIYTFGRHRATRRAAEADVREGEQGVLQAQLAVRRLVLRAYDTLILSHHSQDLLQEGGRYVEKAQNYIEQRLEEDEDDASESDRLRVEVLAAELEARLSDTRRGIALATSSLRILAQLDDEDEVEVPTLEPRQVELPPLRAIRQEALAKRPELEAARAHSQAQRQRRRAAGASYFPEIRLVGELDYAYSNVVDDQQSPFVHDSFNYLRYGIGLAMRVNLDFFTDRARVKQATAALREAEAKEETVRQVVTQEIEEAYLDVTHQQEVVAARRRGQRAARGWLFSVMQGIDVGVLDPPEAVDALKSYFEQSFLYIQAVTELNSALRSLELSLAYSLGQRLPSGSTTE
jgi:outer membrane protein TolC